MGHLENFQSIWAGSGRVKAGHDFWACAGVLFCVVIVCIQYSCSPGNTQQMYSAILIRYVSSARGSEVVEVVDQYRPRLIGVRYQTLSLNETCFSVVHCLFSTQVGPVTRSTRTLPYRFVICHRHVARRWSKFMTSTSRDL